MTAITWPGIKKPRTYSGMPYESWPALMTAAEAGIVTDRIFGSSAKARRFLLEAANKGEIPFLVGTQSRRLFRKEDIDALVRRVLSEKQQRIREQSPRTN